MDNKLFDPQENVFPQDQSQGLVANNHLASMCPTHCEMFVNNTTKCLSEPQINFLLSLK